MSVGQQSLMKQAFGPEEDDSDIASYSTDTSRWSPPPIQSDYKQKKSPCKLKLPPIKTMQDLKPSLSFASMNLVKELKSQVWDLQQQLSEARIENRLLKQVQHRQEMELQHFQQSEGSIEQIVAKHNSEARALQKLLRETRVCRDNLQRQLQATENKLLNMKEALQHLQQLSQDQNLLEREELTIRLAKATAELEDNGKRMQDMERKLELCQASFKRQTVTEQRKVKEASSRCFQLQGYIHQLTTEIQKRKKEMERHDIYSHRSLKASTNGRENKMVQMDG